MTPVPRRGAFWILLALIALGCVLFCLSGCKKHPDRLRELNTF